MDSEFLKFEFEHLFRQWSVWYRLRRSVAWLLRGLIFGLALALGFSLVGLAQEGLLKEEYFALVLRFTFFSTAVAALAGTGWPVSKEQLARFFDQHFKLKERSSTSLELLKQRKTTADEYIRPEILNPVDDLQVSLVEKQLKDTLIVGSRVRPQALFFLQMTRSQVILVGTLVVGLVLVGVFGEPLFQRARQQRLTSQAIAQEAARLEALAEHIRADEKLTPAQRQEIAQTLEEAVKKLNEAQTTEQSVAVLASAENQLRALENEQAQEQAEGLQNAGKRLLEENPAGSDTPLQSFAQNLAEGDYLGASQDLANLDVSQLSQEEIGSLADQLEEASRTLEDSNPELAQQMAEAAQALRDGNIQEAQQTLQQAAQALANTGQQIAQSQAASQAAGQVSQGQDRLIQAGGSQGQQAQVGQPGQGQGSQMQGSNNQSGNSSQGTGGSGAGEGESAGQEGQGPEAGADPIGQDNKAGDGGMRSYEEIFAPQRLGGSGGEEVNLPGSGQPGDQIMGQGDTTPGDPNASRVPYVDVLAEYTEAYRQAIESGQVPVTMRALVRKYFSSLEP